MAGVGNTQIINGQTYTMYSPQWYAAMDAENTRQASMEGTNAGTKAGAAVTALRGSVPDLFGTDTSSTSSTNTSTPAPAPAAPPRVSMPSASPQLAPAPTAQPQPQAPTGMPSGYAVGGPVTLRPVDTSAADAARFGRAKDTVGASTRSALTSLRSTLASRGQLGGAGESHGTSAILTKGLGSLNDMTREQAIQGSERDADRAALEFTGGITERGQDMGATEAANSLAERLREVAYQGDITQRGQDLAAATNQQSFDLQQKQSQQALLDRILSALNPLY